MARGAHKHARGSLQPPTPAAMKRPAADLPPIHTVRGQRVVLDRDLATLYSVATKSFNQTIHRNVNRFPRDFAFQLTREEVANLKSQIVTSSSEAGPALFSGYGGARKLPFAFTEHGAIMALVSFICSPSEMPQGPGGVIFWGGVYAC